MSNVCPTCGESFETDHGLKVHHKLGHGESIARKELTCETCEDAFEEFQSRINNGRGKFCSTECKHNAGRTEVTCCRCGETVEREKFRTGRYENVYCSVECHREYLQTGGEAAPGWQGGAKMTEECEYCSKEVTRTQSQFGDHVFCSPKCEGMRKRGTKNPLWTGGVASWYGPNWNEQREKALERDDQVCQSCGIDSENHVREVGRGLEVHHITPLSRFRDKSGIDYESANCLSNLVTLCMSCHREWEGIPVAPRLIA